MKKPTLHVIGLPHTQVAKGKWSQCAYTTKTVKFCRMMHKIGYPVTLYASDLNETPAELVTCITKEQQDYFLGEEDWYKAGRIYEMPYKSAHPAWKIFNQNVILSLSERLKEGDIICFLTGQTQREIQNRFMDKYKCVEYGIGYEGTWNTPYKVFESYAWRHYHYGRIGYNDWERQYHEVIPNYFEVEDFPFSEEKDDYLLFMARPIPAKGIAMAISLANELNIKVKVAGAQKVEGRNIEWVGYADEKLRGELMSRARGLLSFSHHIEPFGGVSVEAQLCGTPVIASAWGGFTETVEHGKTGFLCRNYTEAKEAVVKLDSLDKKYIRERAVEKYSTETIAQMYDDYFIRIAQ